MTNETEIKDRLLIVEAKVDRILEIMEVVNNAVTGMQDHPMLKMFMKKAAK